MAGSSLVFINTALTSCEKQYVSKIVSIKMFFVFLFCQQFFLCLDTGKCFEGEEERKVLLKFRIFMSVKGSNTL